VFYFTSTVNEHVFCMSYTVWARSGQCTGNYCINVNMSKAVG